MVVHSCAPLSACLFASCREWLPAVVPDFKLEPYTHVKSYVDRWVGDITCLLWGSQAPTC